MAEGNEFEEKKIMIKKIRKSLSLVITIIIVIVLLCGTYYVLTIDDGIWDEEETTSISDNKGNSGILADGLDFTNTYEAGTTSVTFGGIKTLNGFPENADSKYIPTFEFTLSEKDKVIDTTTVSKDGLYGFKPVTYDKEGTYTYTIKEERDEKKKKERDSRSLINSRCKTIDFISKYPHKKNISHINNNITIKNIKKNIPEKELFSRSLMLGRKNFQNSPFRREKDCNSY